MVVSVQGMRVSSNGGSICVLSLVRSTVLPLSEVVLAYRIRPPRPLLLKPEHACALRHPTAFPKLPCACQYRQSTHARYAIDGPDVPAPNAIDGACAAPDMAAMHAKAEAPMTPDFKVCISKILSTMNEPVRRPHGSPHALAA